MKPFRFRILLVCFAIQLMIPLFLVWRHYDTLRNGEQYKIEVTVADPYDPFRGRYVAIRPVFIQAKNGETTTRVGDYVKLEKDRNGYALITSYNSKDEPGLIKDLTIDKYYMSEAQAPQAENILQQREEGGMYVILCVKNGKYVIEGLYYNDQPIEEYLLSQGVQ